MFLKLVFKGIVGLHEVGKDFVCRFKAPLAYMHLKCCCIATNFARLYLVEPCRCTLAAASSRTQKLNQKKENNLFIFLTLPSS